MTSLNAVENMGRQECCSKTIERRQVSTRIAPIRLRAEWCRSVSYRWVDGLPRRATKS
jgi:hypothetical protein